MVPETEEQRQLREAERRGREWAEVLARLSGHDKDLTRVDGALERVDTKLDGVDDKLDTLATTYKEHIAVDLAVAKAIRESIDEAGKAAAANAEKTVSTRTFVLGLILAVTAVLTFLSAVHP